MAGIWLTDLTQLPISNFDNDNDVVTGTSGARANLLTLIQKLNVIIQSVDSGAKIYTDKNKSTLAFKDASNIFTVRQELRNILQQYRDISSTEQTFLTFGNSVDNTSKWGFSVDSNGVLRIRDSSSKTIFQLYQGAGTVEVKTNAITYNGKSLQLVPKTITINSGYSTTLGTSYIINHGVGSYPTFINIHLINTVAEFGYTPGQRVHISAGDHSSASASTHGITVYDKSINEIAFKMQSNGILINNISAGADSIVRATAGRWSISATMVWLTVPA